MLTGRESLVRLIGKRRRALPNRQSLLSSPIQRCLDPSKDRNGGTHLSDRAGGSSSAGVVVSDRVGTENGALEVSTSSDWVTCPVCAKRVRGGDDVINYHLDACLNRGTKRKLTQRTLLQSNFSRSKVKIPRGDLDNLQIDVIQNRPENIQNRPENNLMQNIVHASSETIAVEEHSCNHCSPHVDSNGKTHSDCSKENSSSDLQIDVIQNRPENNLMQNIVHASSETIAVEEHSCNHCSPHVDSNGKTHSDCSKENSSSDCYTYFSNLPLLPYGSENPVSDMDVSVDKRPEAIFQTFIVGRQFSDKEEIHPGASILLMRDPHNIKDANAIKVFTANSGCSKLLGFLPRELAQYLSPLIHKYDLRFEGYIASVPKDSLDIVPIQIGCGDLQSFGENFNSSWENVLHVVEYMKTCPPRIAKYQKNFCLLVNECLSSNSHLLTDIERIFLESFLTLSNDSQRLFVRLYTRKGPWFRTSNISYSEILDSRKAIKELIATGYISSFESTRDLDLHEIAEVLNVFTVSELRDISSMLKKNCSRDMKKQDVIGSILSSYQGGLCPLLPNMIVERAGTCIQISSTAESLIWRAQRLFFLNGEQDLSAFLLVDMGLIKYPNYNCIITKQIFIHRCDLLAYEEAIEVAQIMDESLDDNNNELVLRCTEIADYRISSSYANASQSAANFFSTFQRHGSIQRYNESVTLLKHLLVTFTSDRRRGYWMLRLSIDLEHLGYIDGSLSVAEDSLLDPWVRAGSRMALQRRVLRLGKPPRRWKVPSFSVSVKRKISEVQIQGRPLNCKTGMKSRFYGEDGEQCGVEQLALQYYGGEGGGWQGVHTESGIWLTIFALLMWDIIFADVADVFRNKYQTAPLDLDTDFFYDVRKGLIESHLQKIRDGMAEELVITSWESHVGTTCRGVNWDRHTLSQLRAAVACIGGPCLASMCRHLALDYRSWSSGMPDLLLWRFHGDHRGEAKLVEVKGPRDQLSEQQRAWLLLLMDCGFNAEVCRVSPSLISA